MSYSYTFRPSRFGRMAGARFRAAQRVPYARRYGAFGPASRSRARSGSIIRVNRGRAGFGRTRGTFTRALYGASRRAEIKNYDISNGIGFTTGTSMAVGTSTATGNIAAGLTQGVGENQRVGREIIAKSLMLRGVVSFNPTASSDHVELFILYVILDTQCNGGGGAGTPCVLGDLFSTLAAGAEQLNMDNTARFRVLKRYTALFNTNTFQATSGSTTIPPEQLRQCNIWIPLNMKMVYSEATGIITGIRTNNIFLAYGSANAKCDAAFSSRIRFTDA